MTECRAQYRGNQPLSVWMYRVAQQLRDRAVLGYRAVRQHDGSLAQAGGDGKVVGDKQQGGRGGALGVAPQDID
ncbi:Uncharacterised protein [Serratia plymuthica]|uniref:Uncharacterized protein n=1 Tax=Serratia plymuthica TaxID=82996 RepID=A0A2X4XYU3_SERPL|nr:Uncharacterised protein [Serratia plymuthica]